MNIPWTQRTLPHTDIPVGPCAWRITLLSGGHADFVRAHPSMIVVDPEDTDDDLIEAGPYLHDLPVLLGIAEPAFARQLEGDVMNRLGLMQLDRVDALVLHVEDPAEIKSGGVLQTMFALRDRGVVGCLGLAHPDANVAEWLSTSAAVRLLGVNYSLAEQAARYRALPSATEHGLSAFALNSPGDDESLRFALAESGRALPVLDRPIPKGLDPMTEEEVGNFWQGYQKTTPPPSPLPRGRPPMLDEA